MNYINDIESLRETSGNNGDLITLLGYYQKGDKEPLNYVYKLGTFIDDGGSAIVVSGLVGAWLAVFDGDISVKHFGANSDLLNNLDNIQSCISYCLAYEKLEITLSNSKYDIDGSLSIPRMIDALENASKFYIKNGSLNQVGIDAILRGNPFVDEISSQLLCFQNVSFSSTSNSLVLFSNNILRMYFESCSFHNIRFCDTSKYLQSIYFINSNIRYWTGDFFLAKNGVYDIKFIGGLVEHGVNFINLNPPIEGFTKTERINGLVLDSVCVEGLYGVALLYTDSNSISVTNSYFEANKGGDILINTNDFQNTNYCVNIINNIHLLGGATPEPNYDGEYYHVIYGSMLGGACYGNMSTGNFSYMKSDYFTCDFRGNYVQGILTNKTNILGNVKTYYGNDLSPETLNYDNLVLKGATIFKTDFNPSNSNIYGWICTINGNYETAQWKPLYSYTQEQFDGKANNSNVLHITEDEIKEGLLTLKDGLIYTKSVTFTGNLDDLLNAGFYAYGGAVAPIVGLCYVTVERFSDTLVHPLITTSGYENEQNVIYSRCKIGAGWTTFKRLLTDLDLFTTNPTTAPLTLLNLNALYPNAILGFEVQCKNLLQPLIYKKNDSGWSKIRMDMIT